MIPVIRLFLFAGFVFVSTKLPQPAGQQNTSPVVKIVSPRPADKLNWNEQTLYNISVTDKEDGDSKFGEITATEVFLEVHYFPDSVKAASYSRQIPATEPPGYTEIKRQDCFNCHTMKSKLIGPSFEDVVHRYKKSSDPASIAAHILKGSSGRWGAVAMPPHPDLSEDKAKQIVRWIMDHAGDPSSDYLRGTEGSFSLHAPVKQGALLLAASYTDHGLNGDTDQSLTGTDNLIAFPSPR